MLELGAVALLAAGSAYGYALYQRGRAHARFKFALEEIARRLGGRTSAGTLFDAPELRVALGGATVMLRLKGIEQPSRGVAIAETPLGPSFEGLRLYVGWEVSSVPRGLEHVPEIPLPRARFEGRLVVRASDAAIATRFVDQVTQALAEAKREARASALEVLCRGGVLQFAVHGIEDSPIMLERVLTVATRMREAIAGDAAGSDRPGEASAAATAASAATETSDGTSPCPDPRSGPPRAERAARSVDPAAAALAEARATDAPAGGSEARPGAARNGEGESGTAVAGSGGASPAVAVGLSPPPDAAVPSTAPALECALCGLARKSEEPWVQCDRCGAAYHHRCWAQATGCIAAECQETRAHRLE